MKHFLFRLRRFFFVLPSARERRNSLARRLHIIRMRRKATQTYSNREFHKYMGHPFYYI
jgi:hypothetical protein